MSIDLTPGAGHRDAWIIGGWRGNRVAGTCQGDGSSASYVSNLSPPTVALGQVPRRVRRQGKTNDVGLDGDDEHHLSCLIQDPRPMFLTGSGLSF